MVAEQVATEDPDEGLPWELSLVGRGFLVG